MASFLSSEEASLLETQATLERLIAASCDAYSYSTAAWYATQLVTATNSAPEAVYTLASCYFRGGEFGRALHVLERAGLLDAVALRATSPEPRASKLPAGALHPSQLHYVYLGALCLSKTKAWERCLHLLETCMEGRGFPALRVPLPEEGADAACEDCAAVVAAASRSGGAPAGPAAGVFPPLPFAAAAASMSAGDRADAALLGIGAGAAAAGRLAGVQAHTDGAVTWRTLQRMSRRYRRWVASSRGGETLPSAALASPCRWASHAPPLQRASHHTPPLPDVRRPHVHAPPLHDLSHGLDLVALLCQLRGEALVCGLGNRERAAHWYLAALRLEPYCAGAAAALAEHDLLPEDYRGKVSAWLRRTLGGVQLLPPGLGPVLCTAAGDGIVPEEEEHDENDRPAGSGSGALQVPCADLSWLATAYSDRLARSPAPPLQAPPAPPTSAERVLTAALPAQLAAAERALAAHCTQAAAAAALACVEADPYDARALDVASVALAQAGRSDDLSALSHAAVKRAPRAASTWHAVGCYYLALGKHAAAYKHFSKAVGLDAGHAPSWMGSGQCLVAQGEVEAALSAFRVARRLRPFCHLPALALGVGLAKTGQSALAQQALEAARALAPHDPAVYHELGVMELKAGHTESALVCLQSAVDLLEGLAASAGSTGLLPGLEPGCYSRSDEAAWEATYAALGHALRKLGRYSEALGAYEKALSLLTLCGSRTGGTGSASAPAGGPAVLEAAAAAARSGSLLAAIAFTHQLAGNADTAVVYYHAALAKTPDDPLCQRQLVFALADAAKAPLPPEPAPEAAALQGEPVAFVALEEATTFAASHL